MSPKPNDSTHLDDLGRVQSHGDKSNISHDENIHSELTLWQTLKKWHRVSLYCVGLTSAILLYGYDYVIVGSTSSMPSFQEDYGQKYDGKWILPSLWLGLWNFASPGASMIGAIIGGFLQDCFGRRLSLAVGSFLSAVGVAILFISNQPDSIDARRATFLAGKAFQGGAIGMVMTTTQTYMSEILPPPLRGSVLTFFSSFTLLGQLIGAGVIYACLGIDNGYVICFASQWPFSAIPLVMAFIIPESPTYLVRKGKLDKALKAQRRLDSPDMDTQGTLDLLQRNIEHERNNMRSTYIDCFKGPNKRRTMIIMFANFLPNIFGLTLLAKASYFLQVMGMEPNLSLFLLIVGIVCGLFANLFSIWTLWKFSRRTLVLTSLSVLTMLWFSIGIAGLWSGNPTIWYTAVALTLVIIVAGLGVWPCSYAISAETSALELRAKSQGIGWLTAGAVTSLFGFVLPYIFNTDQGNLGGKTGFVFTGLCAIGLVISYFVLPEMKGRSAAEIDMLFEREVKARHSKSWRPSSIGQL